MTSRDPTKLALALIDYIRIFVLYARKIKVRQGNAAASAGARFGGAPRSSTSAAAAGALDTSCGLEDHVARRVIRTPTWTSGIGCVC
jgi:hypothetical protein